MKKINLEKSLVILVNVIAHEFSNIKSLGKFHPKVLNY